MPAFGNMERPSDKRGVLGMGSGGFLNKFSNDIVKVYGKILSLLQQATKETDKQRKNIEASAKAMAKASGRSGNGGGSDSAIGLGSFDYSRIPTTPTERRVGYAAMAAAPVAIGMGVMPNTMSAVNLRMAADTVAGLSGTTAANVIQRANQAVAGGATSATGATMAMATTAYRGGYLANTLSSKSIMSSVGGLSALTGASNEQVAGSLAGMNGMTFLRAGVQIRDSKGNLKPIPTIINDVYSFLFGNQNVSVDQVFYSVMNPGGRGYNSLLQITGGDQGLMQQIQMGIVARAKSGKALSKNAFTGPGQALNLMGIDKNSPEAAQFKYNTSQANLLQSTQQGLVSGYSGSLNAAAAANDNLAKFADQLPGVTDALGKLKGVLETFPGLGGIGAVTSGILGSGMGLGRGYLQAKSMQEFQGMALRGQIPGITGGTAEEIAAFEAATARRGGGLGGGMKGRLLKGGSLAILGELLNLAKNPLDKSSLAKGHPGLKKFGDIALTMGKDAAFGASIGSIIPGLGTGIGAAIGTGFGLLTSLFGGGGGNTAPSMGSPDHGSHHKHPVAYPSPVHRVTSGYGYRQDPHNPSKTTMHSGLDFGTPVGTPVKAAADGVVSHTGIDKDYGRYVIITHGKKSTLYAHLSSVSVRTGQKVSQGDLIGKSGGKAGASGSGNSTGPHLHFEIRDNGGPGAQGRVDPRKYIDKNSQFSPKLPAGPAAGVFSKLRRNYSANVAQDIESLQSEGLSSHLVGGLTIGQPMNLTDWIKNIGNKSNIKASDGTALFDNQSMHIVAGDKGHKIPGGSREAYMRMLYEAGFRGKGLQTAFAVSMAESKLDPHAIGDVNLQDAKWGPSIGLFQIRSLKHWSNFDGKGSSDKWRNGSMLSDYRFNIKAAWEKSNHGKDWKAWSTYTGGEFAKYLRDASVTSKNLGYGMGGNAAPSISMPDSMSHSDTIVKHNSSATLHANQKIDIKVAMTVNIQSANYREVEKMVHDFQTILNKKLKAQGISAY